MSGVVFGRVSFDNRKRSIDTLIGSMFTVAIAGLDAGHDAGEAGTASGADHSEVLLLGGGGGGSAESEASVHKDGAGSRGDARAAGRDDREVAAQRSVHVGHRSQSFLLRPVLALRIARQGCRFSCMNE